MLKKLLMTKILLVYAYSAAPPAQSSAASTDSVAVSALVNPIAQATVYPSRPAACYSDIFRAALAGDLNAVQ